MRAYEKLVIFHFEDTILALGKDVAVGLTVHGLRTESSSNHVNLFSSELFLDAFGKLEALYFDNGVLLGTHSLSLCSIVISARLSIKLRVNGIALAKFDLVSLSKSVKLPLYEAIIEGIDLSGDEGAAPVNEHAERFQVLHTLRREELKPELRVLELRNLSLGNSELYKNLELGRRLSFQSLGLALLNFASKAASCGMDWHASAMEGEGEKNILSELALITNLELALRHGVSMTYIILNKT